MDPIFPQFKRLTLNDKENLEHFVGKFPPYSDFNFTSLWTYNTDELVEFSYLNSNLVLLFQDYLTGELFYTFIGTNKITETVNKLLNLAKKNNLKNQLRLIPELVIVSENNLKEYFKVLEDFDNHDYILLTSEIAQLKGGKHYDKRNLINRFRKKFPNLIVRKMNLANTYDQKNIEKIFHLWIKQANKSKDEADIELKSISRLLESIDHFTVYAQGIYDMEKLVGFTTYEKVNSEYGIVSFQKADRNYDGIYSVLTNEVAKHLEQLNCLYINFEQDLGIPGLKKAKKLWRPVKYLKKYIVSPK